MSEPPLHERNERELLLELLDQPTERRAAALLEVCQGNDPLRERLLKLLENFGSDDDFMERPAVSLDTTVAGDCIALGRRIGSYNILELIGEGGMGMVYVAEQTEPLRRKVALKIIKPGMDSRQVVKRFEMERQTLALMEHPNIARVLDAGATDQGLPFFVMELVRGQSVTRFCDQASMTTRQRLELFTSVCHAVQHAHHKGIIHRDLKPTNVLVTQHDRTPVVKVIDFGIAKALCDPSDPATVITGWNQFVGTPLYMSPEQCELSGLDIDTRSDIYSLGVLLYEILTGQTPFEKDLLRQHGWRELQRRICEEDPPRPSERVSTLRAELESTVREGRQVNRQELTRELRGELDWIVMKALERDRSRRYESAAHLAADIRRYLDEEPVLACPPSGIYLFKKFVRKHRVAWASALFLFLSLLVAVVGLSWGLKVASDARRDAEQREGKARAAAEAEAVAKQEAIKSRKEAEAAREEAIRMAAVARDSEADTRAFSDFVVNHLLSAARPERERGGLGVNVTVRDALSVAEQQIPEVFQGQPRAEAIARYDLGVTFRLLGDYAKAERNLRLAWTLRSTSLGRTDLETINSLNSLAVVLTCLGRDTESRAIQQEIVELQMSTPGAADNPTTYVYESNLAASYFRDHKFEEAIQLLEHAAKHQRRLLPRDDKDLLNTLANLGYCYIVSGKVDAGLKLQEEACSIQLEEHDRRLPSTLTLLGRLADGYAKARKPSLALPIFQEILTAQRELLGEEHSELVSTRFSIANCLMEIEDATGALPLLEDCVERRKVLLGPEHPETIEATNSLGVCLHRLKRFADAAKLFDELIPIARRVIGDENPLTVMALMNGGLQYRLLSLHEQALQYFELALRHRDRLAHAPLSASLLLKDAAYTYVALKEHDKAVPLFLERVELLQGDATQKLEYGNTLAILAVCFHQLGRLDEEEVWRQRTVNAIQEREGTDSVGYVNQLRMLGVCQFQREKYAESEATMREVQVCFAKPNAKEPPLFWESELGEVLLACALREERTEPTADQTKLREAESLLLTAKEKLARADITKNRFMHQRLIATIEALIELYEFLGDQVKMDAHRSELSTIPAEPSESTS